jgi:hypothetical protein
MEATKVALTGRQVVTSPAVALWGTPPSAHAVAQGQTPQRPVVLASQSSRGAISGVLTARRCETGLMDKHKKQVGE